MFAPLTFQYLIFKVWWAPFGGEPQGTALKPVGSVRPCQHMCKIILLTCQTIKVNKILNFREEPNTAGGAKESKQIEKDEKEKEQQKVIGQMLKEIENTLKSLVQALSVWAA